LFSSFPSVQIQIEFQLSAFAISAFALHSSTRFFAIFSPRFTSGANLRHPMRSHALTRRQTAKNQHESA
jgi:hypothetical protein